MAVTYVQPGQSLTAGVLNNAFMVGQVVFTATRDTAQAITSTSAANTTTANAIQWDAVSLDDLGGWASATPTRYTAQRAGWYELNGTVSFGNATGNRVAGWYVNGSLIPGGHSQRLSAAGTTHSQAAATLAVLLNAGDYVELAAGQDSGSSISTATGGPRPSISLKFVRPA
ncbi:hypothetical protein [Streptomyces shenzhenensis]|uniref:C1q domain-containing protein n=1 Tax=Streptomyces shenzhenensis TaxID=943815 RepID=A0A3M0I3D7_9ACTN|nr:hypothetical protein [Streptomyces shenzhenensis]RMB81273.1 hypothetical protein CTZ28_35300 [Streptomyces shenzhenensis]